ncbi:hypothetical protein C4573_03970 [Candidatus Woesearchaeota archaeon]|nr:MAG: hypothetical protein C4573_03970 [Candidatus Woesearchaeota archaeon]
MKILAFGDTHDDKKAFARAKEKAKQVDIAVCIGDLSVFQRDIDYFLKELNSFPVHVLLVHGNHEDLDSLKKQCEKYDNIFLIHDGFYKKDDVMFLGYGGGGFSTTDAYFEERAKVYKQLTKGRTVFVLHQPPYGKVDTLYDGSHVGNKSFTRFIEEVQPVLVICGHIHETFKEKGSIGESLVVNPGPDGLVLEI